MLPGQGVLGPLLLWIGPAGKEPAMRPMRALWKIFEGHADLVAAGCEACTCGAVSHTCTLPTSMMAYDVWPCPAGQQGLPFDAASPWNGSCDDSHPILAPNNVQSLMVGAIDLVESCTPVPKKPNRGPISWSTSAVA